jgi:hypothetical protein
MIEVTFEFTGAGRTISKARQMTVPPVVDDEVAVTNAVGVVSARRWQLAHGKESLTVLVDVTNADPSAMAAIDRYWDGTPDDLPTAEGYSENRVMGESGRNRLLGGSR